MVILRSVCGLKHSYACEGILTYERLYRGYTEYMVAVTSGEEWPGNKATESHHLTLWSALES